MKKDFILSGTEVIRKEAEAILGLEKHIDQHFKKACEIILQCERRIVVMGLGKSGHIGGKIAATLASTGTPSFFVHAAEAIHGDFGMLMPGDVVLAISNSGKTNEILMLIPHIKESKIKLITITSDPESPLAKNATVNLNIDVKEEACNLTLAPTSSSTASLVMGDALAIAVLRARGFTSNDFARSHPGGTLGKRLLLRVNELMHKGDTVPTVQENATLKEALMQMTAKRLGMTCIVNKENQLLGVFTDGDLRRTLEQHPNNALACKMTDLMTKHCSTVKSDILAFEALNLMENNDKRIMVMPVVDENKKVLGVIHLHDILEAGIV